MPAAGLAAIAIDASPRGLLGALVQYQSSFAGDSDRQHVESATFQPFIIHNLPKGWYLRSTGTWTWDLKNNTHYIPVGLGVGKAWKAGSNILNAFVEPQWTVERKGDDLPQFTLFAGILVGTVSSITVASTVQELLGLTPQAYQKKSEEPLANAA